VCGVKFWSSSAGGELRIEARDAHAHEGVDSGAGVRVRCSVGLRRSFVAVGVPGDDSAARSLGIYFL
jgi:hypothetical protein